MDLDGEESVATTAVAVLEDVAAGSGGRGGKGGRGRGRPRGSRGTAGGDTDEGQSDQHAVEHVKGRRKDAAAASKVSKQRGQCMGCGKFMDRGLMANARYCVDDKAITDRLYKAAQVQSNKEWLSEQLTMMDSCMNICSAYKARFPGWKTERCDSRRFTSQYRELVQAESAVEWSCDGIMMNEERYCQEMLKPERGGIPIATSKAKFSAMLADPQTIRDVKLNKERVRVDIDDHVRYINKFSRLKQLIHSEAAKKNMKQEEVDILANRVLTNHDQGVAGQDVDLMSMAQRIAMGGSRGANAFDSELFQMGDLKDLVPAVPLGPAAAASPGPASGCSSRGKSFEDEDGGLDPKWGEEGEGKWMDMDRAISRAMRVAAEWVDAATLKCRSAWTALHKAQLSAKDVSHKVSHDLDVARSRQKALGLVMAFKPEELQRESPGLVVAALAQKNLEGFQQDVRVRAHALVEARAGAGASPSDRATAALDPLLSSSCASAAGERARLGLAPPCRSYEDLVTLLYMKKQVEEFLDCGSKESIDEKVKATRPAKKAIFELVGLCQSVARELNGAATSARKRMQQEQASASDESSKKRRHATPGSAAGDPMHLFEALPPLACSEDIPSFSFPAESEGGRPAHFFEKPFIVGVPTDHEGLPATDPTLGSLVNDFRVEFEASPLRMTAGRAQKAVASLAADPNVEQKCFDHFISPILPKTSLLQATTDNLRATMALVAFGLCKNKVTCIPEKGHLATACLALEGSTGVVAIRTIDLLAFFEQEARQKSSLADAITKLKCMPLDTVSRFGMYCKKNGCALMHGTLGVNDLLFAPAGWITVQNCGVADVIGLKARFIVASSLPSLSNLAATLRAHSSPSSLLDDAVQLLATLGRPAGAMVREGSTGADAADAAPMEEGEGKSSMEAGETEAERKEENEGSTGADGADPIPMVEGEGKGLMDVDVEIESEAEPKEKNEGD